MKTEYGFERVVSTEEELHRLIGEPSPLVTNKVITYLDHHCKEFIAKTPFLVLSTSDQFGNCDASPRGDAAGFVHILDDKHFIIPERPGNKRMDSMKNILQNPKIGLIFIIPGLDETLRVNGKAYIIKDEELLAKMKVKNNIPILGIGVQVDECFIHCAKAFRRSSLWQSDSWFQDESLPQIAKVIADHVNLPNITEEDVEKRLQESYNKRLY